MHLSGLIVATYFLIKLLAYAGWCWVGMGRFTPERPASVPRAFLLGLLRQLLGLCFGVLIFLASVFVFSGLSEAGVLEPTAAMVATYLAVYVPVRWIEWGILELVLHRPSRALGPFLRGADRRARAWRFGGTLVSCLADVPFMLAAGGLPIGRFMC